MLPVDVSMTKLSMNPRMSPSLVITVFPRSSEKNLRMSLASLEESRAV